MARLAAVVLSVLLLSACGGSKSATEQTRNTPSPSPSVAGSGSASPAAASASTPGFATAMDAAKAGAQQLAAPRQMVVVDGDSCPPQPCMSSPRETAGDHAAYVIYQANPTPPGGNGPGPLGCYVYVNQDSGGWHFYNGACTQNGMVPQLGDGNVVSTPGTCGNVREQPNTGARIIKCVADRTELSVDGGPTWNDSHLWWHIKGSGWMAHDNLMLDFHPGAQNPPP